MTTTLNKLLANASFLISAAKLEQLPTDEGMEIAFVGRSNAGKSTALNRIAVQRLAKTSKTPGRTQLINIFTLDEQRRLVDLPGYGFAKVPPEVKLRWQRTLTSYLNRRQCLRGLVLLMDIRHPLKPLDLLLIELAQQRHLALHILLTKADKLSRSAALQVLQQVKKSMAAHNLVSVQLFSATTNIGIEEAQAKLAEWLMV